MHGYSFSPNGGLTIAQIGELVNRAPEAAYLNHLISAGFKDLQSLAVSKSINKRVAYIIWKDPYLFAGRDTFIDDILRKAGGSQTDLDYIEQTSWIL